ncbi:MAG: ferredoxin [Candidatus Woesearchaeota archaeon]
MKIKFDKEACIGCGACAAECPENWEMDDSGDTYKAKPKKLELKTEEEISKNKAAAEICPVQAIKVE